jgi:hypothetical protein
MAEKVSLVREVYGRNTYTRVIDTEFSELYTPVTASQAPQITVEQFFSFYNELFFQIPATGEVNSHQYIVARSTEYLGGGVLSDTERAYIEEINALRQQLLDQAGDLLDLNTVI